VFFFLANSLLRATLIPTSSIVIFYRAVSDVIIALHVLQYAMYRHIQTSGLVRNLESFLFYFSLCCIYASVCVLKLPEVKISWLGLKLAI